MMLKQLLQLTANLLSAMLQALIFGGSKPATPSRHRLMTWLLLATLTASASERFTLTAANGETFSFGEACDNVINGGQILGDETGCPNPTWDPSLITSLSLPTGGTGALEFLWIFTTGDPTQPLTQWTPIPNTNTPDYDPGPIALTTHYRRCVRRAGCTDYVGESNIVTKAELCCFPVTDGGSIAADQVACKTPFDPEAFTNLTLPSGGMGTLEYQWLISTTGTAYTPMNPDWTLIAGANSEGYDHGIVNQTTHFIRLSRRFGCTDYNGVSNMVTVTIPPILTATAVPDAVTCFGGSDGSVDLTLNGGTSPFSFSWSPAQGNVEDPSGLSAGTYTVTVTDGNSCTATASATVADGAQVSITVANLDETCFGFADGSATVTSASGGTMPYSYLWNDPASQTTATAGNLVPGNYSVIVTDGEGCTATGSVEIEPGNQLILSTLAMDALCFGSSNGTVTVSVAGGNPTDFFYLWDDPAASATATVSGLPAGTYNVTVTDEIGCTATSNATVNHPTPLVLAFSSTPASCFDSSDGTATVTPSGGTPFADGSYTYIWDAAGNPTVQVLDDVSPGTYSVTVLDANNCGATGMATIDAPTKVNVSLSANHVTCFGASNGSVSSTPSGGTPDYTYLWSNGWTATAITGLAPGSYGLTVTDSHGCTGSSSTVVTEPALLTLDLQKTDVICPEDSDGQVTAIAVGGTPPYDYLWGDGQTSASITNLPTGTYSLTLTDGNGCTALGSSTIVFTSDFAGSATSTNALCAASNDGTATAIGTGGLLPYNYLWNNGATAANLTGLAPGNYAVTLTDGNGCTKTASVSITAPPQLTCSTSLVSPITLFGGANGSVQVNSNGGVLPHSYLWSNGAATDTVANLVSGIYSVTVTDANGCTCARSITVKDPSKVGNFVWNDLDQDGIQDAGEPGLEGVTLYLTGNTQTGTPVSLSTQSGVGGSYAFDGLAYGFYEISADLPPFSLFSPNDVGSDFFDNDVNPATGSTPNFALAEGYYDQRWDVGIMVLDEVINIGDYVWHDLNRNGIQDLNENGVEGVTVRLLSSPGSTILASTETDGLGHYLFSGVGAGDYVIEFLVGSIPAGYVFADQDQGSDDKKDSDANVLTGRTAAFTVLPYTPDNLTIDAGLHKECDNITDGGVIGYDENLCGSNPDPAAIVEVIPATGGYGAIEYLWIQSHQPIWNGPGDLNWTPIPNSNAPTYNPGPIGQTTYYIRCSRREDCDVYVGESNIVAKTLIPSPLAQIIDEPFNLCVGEPGRFEAAIAGGGATYHWEFGADASPSSADTRVVNPVSWTSAGLKTVTLTVTRFGCSWSATTTVNVTICGSPLIIVDELQATMQGNDVHLHWQNGEGLTVEGSFLVERSADGTAFAALGSMPALPADKQHTYHFMDTKPQLGENIYRIQFQPAGGMEPLFSNEISLSYEPDGADIVSVYPNPVAQQLSVELFKSNTGGANITVSNALGKSLMFSEIAAGMQEVELDLSALPEGVYFVKVTQAGWKEQVRKIIKTD